jgi:CRISPR type III-B/RAMP module RAMP protein Cmr6
MAKDVRKLVGDFADAVDNRSLLYEKFSLPKVWGQADGRKLDDAGRWSVLRIVTRGSDLLNQDAANLDRRAGGRNVQPHNVERLRHAASLARKMAAVAVARPDPKLAAVCAANGRQLLADLERAYGKERSVTFEATLGGRLLVNLAGGVVENAGICLDRCFGLPFLPGSAVKGIARTQALWEIREASDADKPRLAGAALLLFGFGKHDVAPKGDFAWAAGRDVVRAIVQQLNTEEFKGAACFLPAYPTTEPTLVVDMVNPHYPEYYRGKRKQAEDNENPIPNYFPAVEAGSVFGFAVLLNRLPEDMGVDAATLLSQAKDWVQRALTVKGAGAKTAAGYGWFTLGRHPRTVAQPPPARAASAAPASAPSASPADPLVAELARLLKSTANFAVGIPKLAALADDAVLRRVFEATVPEFERRRLRRNNPYWQSFTSGRHAEAGKKILQRLGLTLS